MQSGIKEIYNITATRTGIDEKIYKDIGDFVFKRTKEHLQKPKRLIIKLKGIGYWFLKRKRMKEVITSYPSYYEIDGYKDFASESGFLKFTNKQEVYKIFKERLVDYEEYLKDKTEIKKAKDEFKRVYDSKEDSTEASQDNP